MEHATNEIIIELRIIRASGLPSRWTTPLRVHVLVLPGGEQLYRTETVVAPEPRWDKTFVISVPGQSARIKLQVHHSADSSTSNLLGEAEIPVHDFLRSESEEMRYKLTKPGRKLRQKRGSIFVSGRVHIDVQNNASTAVQLGSAPEDPTSSSGKDPPLHATSNLARPMTGPITNFLLRIPPDSLPPVRSDLSLKLEKTENSVGALSTPQFLQNKLGVVSNVASSSGDVMDGVGDVISDILQAVIHLGDAFSDVHPYAKIAWAVIKGGYQILKAQIDRDDRIRVLWVTALDVAIFLQSTKREALQGTYLNRITTNVIKQIYECCQFLRKYGERSFFGRTLKAPFASKWDDGIQGFSDSFTDLKEKLIRGLSMESWTGVRAIGNDLAAMSDTLQDLWLYTLIEGNIPMAECDTRRGCLPGTRTKLIDNVVQWIHDPSRGRLLWLSGAIGTGKSSVANTIVGLLKGLGRLGASCRFEKQVDPSAVFRHLAYQLARVDKSVKDQLVSVLKSNGDLASAPLSDQALKVIVQPLHAIDLVGPVVLVFDALDEITHRGLHTQDDILAFFADDEFILPEWVKIVITSRDEVPIRSQLELAKGTELLSIDDYDGTGDDIFYFVQHRLQEIAKKNKLAPDWPPEGAARTLADRAEGQFQWASITCQFIAGNPLSRLSLILTTQLTTHDGIYSLDHLYDSVLQDAHVARNRKPSFIMEFGYVVGTVAAAMTSFHLVDLNDFLDLRTDKYNSVVLPGMPAFSMEGADQVISLVRCLFYIPVAVGSRLAGGLRLVHTSLFEYLTDSERCPRFHIHLPYWNLVLAIRCLRTINRRIDRELSAPELGAPQIHGASTALRYSCQFFLQHVAESEDRTHEMLASEMDVFISGMLLKWVETMRKLGLEWKDILRKLMAWYYVPQKYKILFAGDAAEKVAFLTSFVGDQIEQLADSEEDHESPASNLITEPAFSFNPSVQDDITDDYLQSIPPHIRIGRVRFGSPSSSPTPVHLDSASDSDPDTTYSPIEDRATESLFDTTYSPVTDGRVLLITSPWDLWKIPKPEAWFIAHDANFSTRQREAYESLRKELEGTVVVVLSDTLSRQMVEFKFVDAVRLLSDIWIYLKDVKIYLEECMLLAQRCCQVLRATNQAFSQITAGSPLVKQTIQRVVDSLHVIGDFFKSLSSMRVWRATFSREQIKRKLRNCNNDLASMVNLFRVCDSPGLTTRQRLELGEITSDAESTTAYLTTLRSLIDTAERPSWAVSFSEIKPIEFSSLRVASDSNVAIKRLQQIARGSSSIVLKDTYKNSIVAIKMLTGKAMQKETFLTTVNIWRALLHLNILSFIGASDPQDPQPWFFVVPYCEAGDVITYVKSKLLINEVLLDMARDIAGGMQYLHEQDIVHRNLQGANVLVAEEETCKITGFTYSVIMNTDDQELARPPLPPETLQWRAPEVLRDPSIVSPDVDVYSFAMTFVEMFTGGNHPWPGLSADAVRDLVLVQKRRPGLPFVAPVDREVRKVIEACWSEDPAARPGFPYIWEEVKSAGHNLRYKELVAQVGRCYDSD